MVITALPFAGTRKFEGVAETAPSTITWSTGHATWTPPKASMAAAVSGSLPMVSLGCISPSTFAAMTGEKTPQQALSDAAQQVNDILAIPA